MDASVRWLSELLMVRDLSKATRKCFRHGFTIPDMNGTKDTPCLGSVKRASFQEALPLFMWTSVEMNRVSAIAEEQVHPSERKKRKPCKFPTGDEPRIDETLARLGIIVQFELWKEYAKAQRYPINVRQAKRFAFHCPDEQAALLAMVDRRNDLVHRPHPSNDPTVQELVEYAEKCMWLARQVDAYAGSKPG